MTNYNQLLKEQRETIEYMIGKNYTFTSIGKAIDKDRTTISKEIKRNRYIKSYFYDAFDPKGINEAINKCPKLQVKPYVCNCCPSKNKCTKHKLFYNASTAQQHYEETLVSSRQGVDITPEIIDEIEHSIVPLIKNKKQSINQIYNNHSDILYFSKVTFYKYVNVGVFSLKNIDLPKKVTYKARKNKEEKVYKRKASLLKGRTYDDYLDFILKHPKMNICEMDTVEGNRNSEKVLLTIIIKKTKFMFIRLLDKKNIQSVNSEIDAFKEKLGIKLYSKVFR
ncbi:MAG: helix-turn-helix domain-containing protein, partial [Floccifex sp.]